MKKTFYILQNNSKATGLSGENLGTLYDMENACKNCGSGFRIKGNLIVKAVKFRNEFIQTLSGDLLISEKTYREFKSKDLNVNGMTHVISYETKTEMPYYFINPIETFPQFSGNSKGISTDEQCLVCKRNGYFGETKFSKNELGEIISGETVPIELYYNISNKNFLEQSDFFYTWEHFGYSQLKSSGKYVIRYARPLVIVSEKVKEIFENLSIKNARFIEVFIN